MTYEVQYKCYLSECLPGLYNSYIPIIKYRYKKSGQVFWEKKDSTVIDHFAAQYWKKEYYNNRSPEAMVTYDRMHTMREILDKQYGGKLRNYVKAIVEFEIMSNLIDKEEERDTLEISLSFLTDGWERTTVRTNKDAYETKIS